jgi:orotate phosphoribosyltransferase
MICNLKICIYVIFLWHIQSKKSQPTLCLVIRKEPKKHGTRRFIEGPSVAQGAKVAIVDDVVTTGGSILKSIEKIEAEGYEVVQVLAILDRLEGGRERLAEAGYNLEPIFTRKDLFV